MMLLLSLCLIPLRLALVVEFTPNTLLHFEDEVVAINIFRTFETTDKQIKRLRALFEYEYYNFAELYNRVPETKGRRAKMLDWIYNNEKQEEAHSTLIPVEKLVNDPRLAKDAFSMLPVGGYKDDLFRASWIGSFDDMLSWRMLKEAVHQRDLMRSNDWIADVLYCYPNWAEEIFALFPKDDMTPDLLSVFLLNCDLDLVDRFVADCDSDQEYLWRVMLFYYVSLVEELEKNPSLEAHVDRVNRKFNVTLRNMSMKSCFLLMKSNTPSSTSEPKKIFWETLVYMVKNSEWSQPKSNFPATKYGRWLLAEIRPGYVYPYTLQYLAFHFDVPLLKVNTPHYLIPFGSLTVAERLREWRRSNPLTLATRADKFESEVKMWAFIERQYEELNVILPLNWSVITENGTIQPVSEVVIESAEKILCSWARTASMRGLLRVLTSLPYLLYGASEEKRLPLTCILGHANDWPAVYKNIAYRAHEPEKVFRTAKRAFRKLELTDCFSPSEVLYLISS
ncbi:hypothetical protein PSACC_02401 [Paramicrosporidium saccamoebae]|uniref:Uncharacterized protein n=1 Tax=Paramicrosporidium saccamoebae TaxID=1246581 RepID=A0A2H9TJ64_9FUNG|nr:hypothetical protein PSACC_02401 [Paramicrosporidium saccamoebae]